MDSLIAQDDATAVYGLNTEHFNGNHRHRVSSVVRSTRVSIENDYGVNGDRIMTNGGSTNTNSTNFATATTVINTNDSNVKDLNHNHTITSSDKETRPVNYTIRVWKRVS